MVLLGGNIANQNIDWWHGALDSTGEHDGDLFSRIGDLSFNYGLTDDWNLQVNITGGSRTMNFFSSPNIHHRNEGRSGLANTKVMFRYLVTNRDFGPGDRFFLGFGLSFPSKNTLKEDPFALGKRGIEHTHFSMSEGVVRGLSELQFFRRTESPLVFGVVGRLGFPLGPSQYGYLPGTEIDLSGMSYFQGYNFLNAMPFLLMSGQFRSEDYWNGVVRPNSGSTIIQTGAGLVWNIGESLVTFSAQLPILFQASMIDESRLVENRTDVWMFSISIRKMFNSFIKNEEEVEEKHDHEEDSHHQM